MKEEKTQGISPEKTRKDSYNTNKKAKETELLDLRAGLPKHGTRWARAQHPMLRELGLEERTAPL
jgi:hypothetical protein